jgi:hypothetical protein
MSLARLPVEIQLEVFRCLPYKDLETCLLLCKACQKQAARIYYETFRLSRINPTRTVSIINNEQNFANIGNWVKTLIVDETSAFLQKKIFHKIKLYSPPLKISSILYLNPSH